MNKRGRKRGNGEGTIFYNEKLKRYVGQCTCKGNRKTVYGKTRAEVRDKLNKILVNISENKYIDKSKLTLQHFVDLYNNDDLTSNRIQETTYARRLDTAKIISKLQISSIPIQTLTATMINNDLLTLTNYSNSVIDKTYGMIKSAFEKALANEVIINSPFNIKGKINKPKSNIPDEEVEALTLEEQTAFMRELDKSYDKYNRILKIALFSGMRIGEILALKESDVDLEKNVIHIRRTLTRDTKGKTKLGDRTKTYSGKRDIPITIQFRECLTNISNSEDLIFTQPNGNFIAESTINTHFKKLCKNAKIRPTVVPKKKVVKGAVKYINHNTSNVNTHMLRHTYATRCIEAGMTAVVLSKLLGHKDVKITLNIYTSVFNKFKNEEIEKYLNYMSVAVKLQ